MIPRILKEIISQNLFSGKAIIIMGARQIGKTTLLNELFGQDESAIWLNGDEIDVQDLFENITSTRLRTYFGAKKIVVIDEAQRITDIGLKLKLITDQIKDVQLIATGSSSFELADKTKESLTGRKFEYLMFPISFAEMVQHHGLLNEKRLIPHRLVYGYYPEVVTSEGFEEKILKSLFDSYLYKDILSYNGIKKSEKVVNLLQALAYQVGSQVAYNELAKTVGLDAKTVEKYIDLFEKCYLIFRLPSYSKNLRNELKFSRKIYFYDNGIRNALISNFLQVESRNDVGALWENFVISERMKITHYNGISLNRYFWRTKEQKEIDYLEERNGSLNAYEFKWNANTKIKLPKQFINSYPEAFVKVITPENLEEFLDII